MSTGNKLASTAGREAAEAEFEELLYHITHDLRASLRALKTVPAWIREDMAQHGVAVPDTAEEGLEMMEIHAERMDQMLLDLRTYSRVGRKHDAPSQVTLKDALAAAAGRVVTSPDKLSLKVSFKVEAVTAPRNEVELIFETLVDNAIKHGGAGRRTVWVTSRQQGDRLVIEVLDDGPGVPSEFRERVFGMLVTLRPRDEVEGSGMGLAIARKICRMHGGEITLHARPEGPGSLLRVVLPAALAEPDPAKAGPRLVQI